MTIETRLFIADLTHLDCAYFDPQLGLVGDTWTVNAELTGDLNEEGMLCDFGIVKRRLKKALDDSTDHRLLLDAAQGQQLLTSGDQSELELKNAAGEVWRYQAPSQAFATFDIDTLAADSLARDLSKRLLKLLPENISRLNLELKPAHAATPYRYCHGLSRHEGNCQRMAHGHRAQLEIRVDGDRAQTLEDEWQARFDRRYIGAAADLAAAKTDRTCFAYEGSQGHFELELPASRGLIIDAEPTIESITMFMAKEIRKQGHGKHIECRAFEGIGKGAICCASD